MSEYLSIEMGTVDRPPNRFQVNPVNHKNNNDKMITKNSTNSAVSENINNDRAPHDMYRRLTGTDGEPIEDDTFNEDTSQLRKAQQQPRHQRYVGKYKNFYYTDIKNNNIYTRWVFNMALQI